MSVQGLVGAKSNLHQVSTGYVKISHYFFLALTVAGLLGAVTGVFAQSQPPSLTLSLSNVAISHASFPNVFTISGTIIVSGPLQGQWTGPPLTFSGWAYVSDDFRDSVNVTLAPQDFMPSNLNYPSLATANFSATSSQLIDLGTAKSDVKVNAHQNGLLVGTTGPVQSGRGSAANLFILAMELPLFQVPQLGISATNPDFANLFSTFDRLPLGDFYMLLTEVAIILLIGAGLINVILYLTGGSGNRNGGTTGTLAGINNIFMTLVLILLLPYAYNTVAGFVNILDQQIIAGPGNSYIGYLANSQLIWDTLPTGGNILTDFIGAIASLIAWVMTWLLGSARIFLIGAVTVAMPIVLVLRNIRFTARFAGVVEDTFFGLIFASLISALFIGLAAYILNHWSGSMFQAGGVDRTWVALAALLGAMLVPTVFAPMTGFFFQTMSQVGMAATGTAFAVGASAVGPGGAGVKGGMAMAGQSLGGLAMSNPSAGFAQKAGVALGGFGGGFARSVPHMAQNMVLMGTVGTLGGLGAGRSTSAVNRAIDLKMPGQTGQSIVAYRAGALTSELKLPGEMKPYFDRALAAGVSHETVRKLDAMWHNSLVDFQNAIGDEIRKVKGIS